jgi:SpoVK/Ycf46/Vps4 family AAA+-type ATPase
LVEPADDARSGGLADLVTTGYPGVRLSDMTLAPATRAQLEQVLHEQRQRDLLGSRGFAPLHRLLLTGPDGTGKSMTASALATELSLPMVTIRIDALIGKYTGEPTPKLRVIFDAMARARSVCLFDDLDAIGARQMAGLQFDIVEGRRVLNTFLSFLDDIQSESLIVAVADHPSLLDDALLRRFDAIIAYCLPDPAQALDLLRRRLGAMNTSVVSWNEVGDHVKGLSQARLVRAAESAAKRAILDGSDSLSTSALIASLRELGKIHHMTGFGFSALEGVCVHADAPRPDIRQSYADEIYATPSGASDAAGNASTNGWTFWLADTPDGLFTRAARYTAKARTHLSDSRCFWDCRHSSYSCFILLASQVGSPLPNGIRSS